MATTQSSEIVPVPPSFPEPQLGSYDYEPDATTFGSNVTAAWQYATSLGVAVADIDDGFTPSFLTNFDSADSQDFSGNGLGEPPGSIHGTATSTEIGGSGADGEPIGMAPNATMVLYKEVFGNTPFSPFIQALDDAAPIADVINCSFVLGGFGQGGPSDPDTAGWYAGLQTAVTSGRGGLGDAVVFPAGNDRGNNDDVGIQPIQDDPREIVVAATDADGSVTSFATGGAGLLVSVLGENITVAEPTGGYTEKSATSFTAPQVSSIIALMLQANPNLGWRDIQEILADSAYEPPASAGTFVTNVARDWNGGGMHFSDDLGFGNVDANVAVNLARAWTEQSDSANLDTVALTQNGTVAVPVNGTAQSSVTDASPERVQHVTVTLVDSNLLSADTKLVLISPSGTQSVLLNYAGNVGGTDETGGLDLNGLSIESNAFWGEPAAGEWTLQVQDSGGQAVGTITSWTLTVYGNAGTGNAPLVYTPEFAQLAATDSARLAVSAKGLGTRTIDLIALPDSTSINLNGGAGEIDGVAVTVASGLRDANLDGNTGPATVTAAASGGTIQGGDGPTTIVGSGGADTITAGQGATTVFSDNDARTVFYGGNGSSTVNGGAGITDIFVGQGADELVLTRGESGGLDVITGFRTGTDGIDLVHYSARAAARAIATQQATDNGTMLTLRDGTRIDLVGVAHATQAVFA